MSQAGTCPRDAIETFDAIRALLKEKLSRQQYNDWIRPSQVVDVEGNILRIGVPSERFSKHWQTHYLPLINQELRTSQSEVRSGVLFLKSHGQ